MAIGMPPRKRTGSPSDVNGRVQRGLLALVGLLMLGGMVAGCGGPGLPALNPPLTAGQPAATPSDDPRAAGLISLEAARASVAQFGGATGVAQTDVLHGGLDRGSFGGRPYAQYNLESPDGGQSFKVDARTAEVLEASWPDRLTGSGPGDRLNLDQAERRAEVLAAERFEGFRDLSLVERRSARAINDTTLYTFKWALLASETGAELPTSVSLSVTELSGALVWYLAQRTPLEISVKPATSRDQAIAAASSVTLAGQAGQAALWDTAAPSLVRLQVIYDEDNRQRLIWAVTFPRRPDGPPSSRPSLRVQVDAQSGQPLDSRG